MIPYQYALRKRCLMAQPNVTVNFDIDSSTYGSTTIDRETGKVVPTSVAYAKVKIDGTEEWMLNSQTLEIPKGTTLVLFIECNAYLSYKNRPYCNITVDNQVVAALSSLYNSPRQLTYLYHVESDCTIKTATAGYNTTGSDGSVHKVKYGYIIIKTD